MAMTTTGEVALPADRTRGRATLDDPEMLKDSVRPRQPLDKTGGPSFVAPAQIEIGAVAKNISEKVLANFAAARSAA